MTYYPTVGYIPSIAPQLFIKLYDQRGTPVALFDTWDSFSATSTVNEVGSYQLAISANDPKCSLFELDGKIELWRRIPGISLDWYCEFVGLHRGRFRDRETDGKYNFISKGLDLNDFLARTCILYPAATVKSYKNVAAETAMKEYAEENCGVSATIANGRQSNGHLSGFTVDTDHANGKVWEGDKSGANLLDTLKEISTFAKIDFMVTNPIGLTWKFIANMSQLGTDRTVNGLDHDTGLNGAGHRPVIFSVVNGNVQEMHYSYDRQSEVNVCMVMGDGDGATRDLLVRSSPGLLASPWNRHETSLGQSGYQSQREAAGDTILENGTPRKKADFSPLQQPTAVYGKDYFMGDRVTVFEDGEVLNKRVITVTRTYQENKEQLQFGFEE